MNSNALNSTGLNSNTHVVAVDGRPLSRPMSGVARVIAGIIAHFPRDKSEAKGGAPNFRFVLYSHLPPHEDFAELLARPDVSWVTGEGWTARKGGLWFNLTLPLLLRKQKVSLFWGAQQVIPPFLPGDLPVVLTYHDLILYFYPEAMRTAARIQQRAVQGMSVRRANRIVSNSRQTMEDMLRKFNYPRERASVSPLGYDAPAGRAKKPKRPMALSFSGPYILAVSTIEPRKNYATLLAAYEKYATARIESRRKALPLVIAGRRGWETPEFYAKLDELITRTGSIHVLEGLDDEELAGLYHHCAFFCMASLYEGFGLPLLEALCAGRPALAADIGSFREIGGEHARYLPPLDVDAWSKALEEFASTKKATGRGGKKSFPCKEWSWERTARIHREAFTAALAS